MGKVRLGVVPDLVVKGVALSLGLHTRGHAHQDNQAVLGGVCAERN